MDKTLSKAQTEDISIKSDASAGSCTNAARRSVAATREWVRGHPTPMFGIVAGVAACIGVAIGLSIRNWAGLCGRRARAPQPGPTSDAAGESGSEEDRPL